MSIEGDGRSGSCCFAARTTFWAILVIRLRKYSLGCRAFSSLDFLATCNDPTTQICPIKVRRGTSSGRRSVYHAGTRPPSGIPGRLRRIDPRQLRNSQPIGRTREWCGRSLLGRVYSARRTSRHDRGRDPAADDCPSSKSSTASTEAGSKTANGCRQCGLGGGFIRSGCAR